MRRLINNHLYTEKDLVKTRTSEKKKKLPSSIWILSDSVTRELQGSAPALAELANAVKKGKERFLFIPWSQWPNPGRQVVETIEQTTERLLRSSRTLRVYAVPDEIAALCTECVENDEGTREFYYRHLIQDTDFMKSVMASLRRDIDHIEEIFKKDGKNVSVNGIARCY